MLLRPVKCKDADYQIYVTEQESNGEAVIDCFAWIKSQEKAENEKHLMKNMFNPKRNCPLGAGFAAMVTF